MNKKSGLILVAIAAVIAIGYLVMRGSRGQFSEVTLESVSDSLVSQNAIFAGRKRDFARYELTLNGQNNFSVTSYYRVPASTQKVPAIILLTVSADSNALFMYMDRQPRANSCAMLAINVGPYFNQNRAGEISGSSASIGNAMHYGSRAAKLALDYLTKHMLIDTSAIYLAAEYEANMPALLAAANFQNQLAGFASLWPERCWETIDDWNEIEFASPTAWSARTNLEDILIVSGKDSSKAADDVNLAAFNASFQGRSEWMASTVSEAGMTFEELPLSIGLFRTVQWVLSMRPQLADATSESPTSIPPNARQMHVTTKSSAKPQPQ